MPTIDDRREAAIKRLGAKREFRFHLSVYTEDDIQAEMRRQGTPDAKSY